MKKILLIIVLIVAVLLPYFTASWGLTESSEARYAEISREMYSSGDYLHPTLMGIRHFHKPPMTYYITAAGYGIFGVNETGARFFLSIALLLQFFFVYRIAKYLYKDENISLAAMLLYLAFPITQVAAKNLTTDCYLTTFIFAAIFFYLGYVQQQKKYWLYLFYISCGLAFLTKGPVGVMPQGLFAIGYQWLFKPAKRFNVHTILALLLGLLVAFSWFIALLIDDPSLLNYFFGHQLVDRVAGNSFDRAKPFWYYFLMMPLLGLPVIWITGDYIIRNRRNRAFKNPVNRLLIYSLLACLLVFSLSSSKLVLYVLPLYLFIALVSARHISHLGERPQRLLANGLLVSFIILLLAPLLAPLVKTGLDFPILPISILSGCGILMLVFCRRVPLQPVFIRPALIAAVGMIFLVMIMPVVMGANELKINSIRPIAAMISDSTDSRQTDIIVYDQLLPSMAFYSAKNIITVYNGNPAASRETQFEKKEQAFKKNYLRLPQDSLALRTLKEKNNYCIITKTTDPLPDPLSFLKASLTRSFVAGKWTVYY